MHPTDTMGQRIERIRQAIHDALREPPPGPKQALWLCYDPVIRDPLNLGASKRTLKPLGLPKHVALAPEKCPGFVLFDEGMDDRLFDASISLAAQEVLDDALALQDGRCVAAWLWAEPEGINHLRNLSAQRRPDDIVRWVRWHDPRVLMQLWPTLAQEQRNTLFSGVHRWTVLDLAGSVQTLATAPEHQNAPARPVLLLQRDGLKLTPEQWQLLDHSGLVLTLLAELRDAAGDEAGPAFQPDDATISRLHRSLARARQLGLAAQDDLIAWAHFTLRGGPVESEAVRNAVAAARSDPGSLQFKLALIERDLPPHSFH